MSNSDLCPFKWWDKKQQGRIAGPGDHPYHLCVKHREHGDTSGHQCLCGRTMRRKVYRQ